MESRKKPETNLDVRLPQEEAERLVEAYLEKEKPDYPTFTLVEDGETSWAFWIVEEDTTSYIHQDGRIEWYGSAWPEFVAYDGDTGNFVDKVDTQKPKNVRRPRC